jgi:hypothetical protein
MLIHARGKNVVWHQARASESNTISSDIKKNIAGVEDHSTESFRLFVCYERKAVALEVAIEDVLASHKRKTSPRW